MSRRLGTIGIVMMLLFVLLAGWTAYLQFGRAAALNASPDNPRNENAAASYARGEITAANGQILAESVPSGKSDYPWKRKYPLGSLTAGVVGISANYYLWGGVEQQYNSYLESHALPAQSWSQLLSPQIGTDSISLTLQPALQQVAEAALNRNPTGSDGAVVAIDPRTGAILAMYSNPTFDPNTITADGYATELKAWRSYNTPDANHFTPLAPVATQETFAPGSTSKVITTAGVVAHDPSLLSLDVPVRDCIPLSESNKQLCNDGGQPCGGTIAVMLPASCDPGYATIGINLGGDYLSDAAQAFGYNSPNPIDLPNVVESFFPNRHVLDTDQPSLAYSAIGQQNVRATALENALIAAGIANHGLIMTPHLLDQITGPTGNVIKTYKPSVWRKALSASQAEQIVPLMEAVVTSGTAYGIFPPQDDVAAKTGTAQTGNAEQQTHDWMIAFAPATDPVIAIAVVVPFQPTSAYGATVAGPIVKCMVEAALAMNDGQKPSNTASTCAA